MRLYNISSNTNRVASCACGARADPSFFGGRRAAGMVSLGNSWDNGTFFFSYFKLFIK